MAMENKKGLTTFMMIVVIFLGFFLVIMLGVVVYALVQVGDLFTQLDGLVIGNQSFEEVYDTTLGEGITAATNAFSILSILVVLGMLGVMIIVSVNTKISRYWIVLDIMIIIFAFGFSTIIQSSYSTVINSSDALLDIFSDELNLASRFILNLPFIISIIGAVIMIFTYLTLPNKEDNVNVLDV